MSADEPRFDPRYDPAFQRGFGGAVRSARSGYAPPPASVTVTTPRSVDVMQPSVIPVPSGATEVTQVTEPDEQAAQLVEHRRNPVLIALAAFGVVLIGGGTAWFVSVRASFDGQTQLSSQGDYFYGLAVMVALAPSLIAIGVATLVGVGFVYAIRWRGRR